jgi:curved DNA-binding protein CbpA
MLTDYDILRISETQDISVIRKAYRKLVKDIHPDVSNESDLIKNHLLFIQINRAYQPTFRKSEG